MDPVEQQDWLLMQRVGHGDEAAMAELYDRFVGLVYKSSKQVLTSRAEAEDAVQESFVRLWQTADRKGARPEQLGLDSSVDFLGPVQEVVPEPGGDHDLEVLRRRIAELPELQRVVIERTYLQGFTLREVSEQLGAPLGTVKSALSRGLGRLRDRLASDNKENGQDSSA
jgi:RNA polymerase sigma-70 factor (ECF subfamily)